MVPTKAITKILICENRETRFCEIFEIAEVCQRKALENQIALYFLFSHKKYGVSTMKRFHLWLDLFTWCQKNTFAMTIVCYKSVHNVGDFL